MSFEQCWGLNADRHRCPEPAAPGQYFCEAHDRGFDLHPLDVFCLPEAEMPPDLVLHLRACSPTWPFPEPSPPIVTFGPAAPAAMPTPPADAHPETEPSPAPRSAENDAEPESLAWLMAALRHSIEEVMAADVKPLQRASTVARLGGLYLRAYRATELTKENRSLRKQVAALSARLAATETPAAPPRTRRTPPTGSNGGSGNAAEVRDREPLAASLVSRLTHDPGSLAGTPTAAPGAFRRASSGAGTRAAGGWLDAAFRAAHASNERPCRTGTVLAISNSILSAAQIENRCSALCPPPVTRYRVIRFTAEGGTERGTRGA